MEKEKLNKSVMVVRTIFAILSVLFLISIIVQIFLAGIAIFVDYGQWEYHRSFIHIFEFIPVIMFILSFFGRIPKPVRWQCAGLYLMIILQYVTTNLTGTVPYIGALHPIIAMILFWRSLVTTQEALSLLKNNKIVKE